MEYLITNIEVNKEYVLLELDNSIKHKIHIVAYTNYYSRVNTYITEEYLSNLLDESNYYYLKDKIVVKLSKKDYTKQEIIDSLIDKVNESNLNRLIYDLEKNNYLNDYIYVKRIFSESKRKLKGLNYIKSVLDNKNIDENITSVFYENYNEEELARKLVNQTLLKLKDKYPKNSVINKISYKLNYNGFNENLINLLISELEYIKVNTNNELLEKDYNKLIKKYQNKYQNEDLKRKVIESLLVKGYNYKSVKALVEGMKEND